MGDHTVALGAQDILHLHRIEKTHPFVVERLVFAPQPVQFLLQMSLLKIFQYLSG